MNATRLGPFAHAVQEWDARKEGGPSSGLVRPVAASERDLLAFHSQDYIDRVKDASRTGRGELGAEDTPAFEGMFEASLFPVGSTLAGLDAIMERRFEHFFNPVGGLHHAAVAEARGFCVFNDGVIAISRALNQYKLNRVAYVDIDAHHGDGVYYEFEPDPRVVVGDIHEDGRFLYPGTGDASETGTGFGTGTKLNIGLAPGSGDPEFIQAFDVVEGFIRRSRPEAIFFQCGADGLAGDPITDLTYTTGAHAYASAKLHRLAHEVCGGRIVAMGGGGYEPTNVSGAWMEVVAELSGASSE